MLACPCWQRDHRLVSWLPSSRPSLPLALRGERNPNVQAACLVVAVIVLFLSVGLAAAAYARTDLASAQASAGGPGPTGSWRVVVSPDPAVGRLRLSTTLP